MTDFVFERALAGHKEMGGRFVALAPMLGEPLIDPKFVRRLRRVKEMGFNVSFFTNGTLLPRVDMESLVRSGVRQFTLSTAPFHKEVYEAVYRNHHYEDLLRGLTALLTLRNKLCADLTVAIAFKSPLTSRETLDLPDFREKVWPLMSVKDRNAIGVQTRGYDTWGGQILQSDLIGRMTLACPPRVKRRPCWWTFVPMVHWDGGVRACACRFTAIEGCDGQDELWVGDLKESSLPEIWFGTKVRELRRRFLHGDLPRVCKACTGYRPC